MAASTNLCRPHPYTQPMSEPVGVAEIADRLGVQPETVAMWRYRGRLPQPRWWVSRQPAWEWADILAWADRTGRLRGGA